VIKGARPCLLFHEIAAIIAVPTLASRGCIMAGWSRALENPIPPPGRRELVTLRDADHDKRLRCSDVCVGGL